jgi:nucleotide-binding universal stress UspA family protein/anti-anti-sigma regulatory factor
MGDMRQDAAAIGGPVIGCVDEGPGGLAAARVAGSLARWLGSRLLLTTVQQSAAWTPIGGDGTPVGTRHGHALLERAARELDEAVEMHVLIGEPAAGLLALAERESADLIVLAAPDPSRTGTLLLGSVYLALAGAGPCPVVGVPPGVETIAPTGPIVCGVDGTEPSTAAAHVAADLAGRLETRLRLVHAAAAPETRLDAAARILRETAEQLSGSTPGYLVERGPPAERLAAVAERESAQLLVTGSRGRGQVASALLGSVASDLATSATRPLVIVPPHARRPSASTAVLTTRRLRSGAAVLRVRGEADPTTARRLERRAGRLLYEAGGRLVIDLSEATAIDRETVRIAERLTHRASELGGCLALVAANPSVRGELAAHSRLVATDALDVALEAVGERSVTEAAGV